MDRLFFSSSLHRPSPQPPVCRTSVFWSTLLLDFLFTIRVTDAYLHSFRPPCLSSRMYVMYASQHVLGIVWLLLNSTYSMNHFHSVFTVLAGLVPALWWWCSNGITKDKSPVQLMYATFSAYCSKKSIIWREWKKDKENKGGNVTDNGAEDRRQAIGGMKKTERLPLLNLICIPFRYLGAETVCPGL